SVHCEHADDARRRLSKIPDADRSVLASRRELGVVRPERDAEHASRVPTQNVQCRFASRPGAGAGRGVPDSDRTILPGRREPGTVIAESHVRRPAFMTQESMRQPYSGQVPDLDLAVNPRGGQAKSGSVEGQTVDTPVRTVNVADFRTLGCAPD